MHRSAWLLGLLALVAPVPAQRPSPAHWTLVPTVEKAPPGVSLLAELRLKLDEPWHMYSLSTPKPGPTGGPTPTTVRLAENPAVARAAVFQPAPVRKFDPNFGLDTETFEKEVVFYLRIDLDKAAPEGPLNLETQMRFQLCTEKECLPPRRLTAAASLVVDRSAPAPAVAIPTGWSEIGAAPAAAPTAAPQPASAAPPQGFGAFLLLAFGLGMAAIFTPCVFPMIPITMSFFLNRPDAGRRDAVTQAVVFCLGIIALFSGLGLAVTAALGPFGVVQLGSNPWVNGFIAAVFLAFALSLLGAFEITLPSGLLTRMNEASSRGGYFGTLLMGLTFSLTSFACVGPFVGTLLAASVQGDRLQPALGMVAFASGLALPFFLLALFPSALKSLPRSGGWMSRVKVVLGFLVLAAGLKYVSNVDQVLEWNLLTRERFLAAWVVLFALPGLYLLGLLVMEGIKRDEPVGAGRMIAGATLLVFAVSLVPGLFGARLGEIEAYIPAPAEGYAEAAGGGAPAPRWLKNDLRGALETARRDQKLVLVAFTGYACTNCHWMKANMFPRPEIAAALGDFLLVELYTDGTDAKSEENQKLQERLFQTVAIPFYAILDADEKVVASFAGLTKDTAQFAAFLASRPAGS